MGIFSRLRVADQATRYLEQQPLRALATPFGGDGQLSAAVVLDDIWAAGTKSVTRAEAMSIGAVSRGRRLVCDVLARQALKAYKGGVELTEQPRWLSTSRYFPARMRTLWTLDDLAFHGKSLWVLDRGVPDTSGRGAVLDAMRVPMGRWSVERSKVYVTAADGSRVEVPDGSYLLFLGAVDGLLSAAGAADTIRAYKNIERQWQARTANPVPVTEIRYTGDDDLTDDEMRDVRSTYIKARNDPDGTVMVTPRGFEVHAHGDQALDLFIQGRNAAALDIARFWGMPASQIDASQVNGSSVDYENNNVGRSAYYDLTLRTWALPFEETLSQDDVTPAGTYVAFDLSGLTANPDTGTSPALED